MGGGGRAKGFGGPVAPAEHRADAEGEGGGKMAPLWLRSGFAERLPEAPLDPDPESFSSDSEGMVRLSLGRMAPFEPFVSLRCGTENSRDAEVVVAARCCGTASRRFKCVEGCEVERGGGLISVGDSLLSSRRGGSGPPKNTRARTDPPSSMGVKMLWDLEDECLRSGGVGGRKCCCCCCSGCGDDRGSG